MKTQGHGKANRTRDDAAWVHAHQRFEPLPLGDRREVERASPVQDDDGPVIEADAAKMAVEPMLKSDKSTNGQDGSSEPSLPLDENQVAHAVGTWLRGKGFAPKIITTRQRGYDIDALHPTTGARWVIEAKGGTSSKPGSKKFGTEANSPGAYFATAAAFHNAVAWTGRKALQGANIGIALPVSRWFDIHAEKIMPACELLGITIFRVEKCGRIHVFPTHPDELVKGHIPRPEALIAKATGPNVDHL